MRLMRRLHAALCASVLLALLAALPAATVASGSPSHAEIAGSGSSWAAVAVKQWIADVSSKYSYRVTFTPGGSGQGRKDFAVSATDFGVSDIPYQGRDPLTGEIDASSRPYVYLPIVAGGTAFPYNLSVAGHQIRNLRLKGATVAKIFTNQIKYWDDAQIKSDNNNKLSLPHIPIIPVVHSEASGSTAQFTAYLKTVYPSIWAPFNHGNNISVEVFPRQGAAVAQNGSDGVMNFITSRAGNGTIGFDEYSYALQAGFPVAKLENAAGYYTLPTQYNDAVALTRAQIQTQNPSAADYLTQKLDQVYVNPDKRTYALSSYSYAIIPTGNDSVETKTKTTAQRQTLVDFLFYSICPGQAEVGPLGYSPLPLYLVQDGFGQIGKLKAADPNVDLTSRDVRSCNNPTFDPASKNLNNNRLAQIAPFPPACDQDGAGPCSPASAVINANPTDGKAPSGTSTGANAGQQGGAGPGAATSGGTHVDPNTGQIVSNSGSGAAVASGDVVGVPNELAGSPSTQGFNTVLYILTITALLIVMAAPVLLSRYWANRRGGEQ